MAVSIAAVGRGAAMAAKAPVDVAKNPNGPTNRAIHQPRGGEGIAI
jgi:hypothetical protein